MKTEIEKSSVETPPAKRSKGRESRAAILLAAAKLATTHGLRGLSIGDLADHLGMSKSGLYAHFESKEALELGAIDTATEIFTREVLEPGLATPPGVRRLFALADNYLAHLQRKVFPGGCFFAAVAAELDSRPGAALNRVTAILGQWSGLIDQCIRDAQGAGELDPKADSRQIVFECQAMLIASNFMFAMSDNPAVLAQGRRGLEDVLSRNAPKGAAKSARRN